MALLALLLLAGCAAEPASDPANAAETPNPDKATIEGTVLNDEQQPLVGAEVGLLEAATPRSQTTGPDGRFLFTGLEAGTYTVAANLLGYKSQARQVELAEGATQGLTLLLEPVPVTDAGFKHRLEGQGYVACGLAVLVVTVTNLNMCPWDAQHKPQYDFKFARPGLVGVMQEVTWTKTHALGATVFRMELAYKRACTPTCSSEKSFGEVDGPSPLRQYVGVKGTVDDPLPLSSVTIMEPQDTPPAAFVYQQRFTHYITGFYHEAGSLDTFTAIPDR